MELQSEVDRWDVTPKEAVEIQRELRSRVVLHPPPGLRVDRIAGADLTVDGRSVRAEPPGWLTAT